MPKNFRILSKQLNIQHVALAKAGVVLEECYGDVMTAGIVNSLHHELAEHYFRQLIDALDDGLMTNTNVVYQGSTNTIDYDEAHISVYDAIRWQPDLKEMLWHIVTHTPDINTKEIAKRLRLQAIVDNPSPKSRASLLYLIAAQTTLIISLFGGTYESKYGQNRRSIFKSDGSISFDSFAELLKDMYEKTPASANRLLKEAEETKDY